MFCVCKLTPLQASSQVPHGWALLQASISAEHGRWDVKKAKLKGMRKITPSQPQGASPRVKGRVPPSVAAAAAAGQEDSGKESDGVKMRLQQAFLEQYSPTEAKASLCLISCNPVEYTAASLLLLT